MKRSSFISIGSVLLALIGSSSVFADDEFRPLFNGKDLSGWVPVNVAPETFTVRDAMIVSTGKPTGVLRTVSQFENFVHRAGMAAHAARGQRRPVRLE